MLIAEMKSNTWRWLVNIFQVNPEQWETLSSTPWCHSHTDQHSIVVSSGCRSRSLLFIEVICMANRTNVSHATTERISAPSTLGQDMLLTGPGNRRKGERTHFKNWFKQEGGGSSSRSRSSYSGALWTHNNAPDLTLCSICQLYKDC